MPKPKLEVKVLEMPCTSGAPEPCGATAFVQVVVQDDPKRQKKIDQLANQKLSKTLSKEHQEGKHDEV